MSTSFFLLEAILSSWLACDSHFGEFLSILDPAAEKDYKLGSALGHDPLLLQQEKLDRPSSIKLPMIPDLSRLQTAQDDLVKPSTSSSLEIGKFPGIPPHKGSWYSVVDNKFSQTPQVVPQAFYNIAKPGYRSRPPASVQQKDLVKLELPQQPSSLKGPERKVI